MDVHSMCCWLVYIDTNPLDRFALGAEPTRISQGPSNMEIIVGESVVLPCQVASDPALDVSFSWAFNGQVISKADRHFEHVGGVSMRWGVKMFICLFMYLLTCLCVCVFFLNECCLCYLRVKSSYLFFPGEWLTSKTFSLYFFLLNINKSHSLELVSSTDF